MRLDWYLADSSSLLRDWGYQVTSQARLTRWINLGRRQVAKGTGCLQALIPGAAPYGAAAAPGIMRPAGFAPNTAPDSGFNAQVGVERYALGMATPFVRAAYQGYDSAYDVFQVNVEWGAARPALRWMPFDDLQAYCRSYNAIISSYPAVWSTQGVGSSGSVWLWPPPSQTLEMEWTCTCLPTDLVTANDYDAIPESLNSGVKFYAAGMAMLSSFRYGPAEAMFRLFVEHSGSDMTAAEGGKVPNYYFTALATS